MKSFFLQILFTSTALAAAVPLLRQAEGLDVVKTVVLKDGQVLDWVRRESQDVNFSLPVDWNSDKKSHALADKFKGLIPQHLRGPEGTVPIPRRGQTTFPEKLLMPTVYAQSSVGEMKTSLSNEDYTGQHWYASTSKQTKVTGGGGGFSMFEPFLETPREFSLLQTAIVRWEAKTVEFGTIPQTLEAGWMYYPPRGPLPMFFVFFNSNGYQGVGDYMAGWNTEQKGWVQVDDSIYPGMSFDHMSVIGGEQHDFDVKFHLTGGKWWLTVLGKDVGYYSADIFSKNSKKDDTLASYGDRIDFFGEVYNSGPKLTTTDMGSGNFPEAGDGKVGYIKNMVYLDGDGKQQMYDGYTQESDSSRYRIKTFFNSGTSWDSYVYLGGPGADGVVGG
ncbi:protein of unknown function DUF239 [Cordyceps javanica]|uniref:Neprosin PEP catalytic domain-containing protein n=1 Tax=Cordyceps javanica TaxID=43265 RepID=A0A545VLJ1_9HYPO|nr:protein of unknown function DUF239 [Cordyceps javanica]TQW02575.1 protein of unknown function DUF239 [Cordyceps javanica]